MKRIYCVRHGESEANVGEVHGSGASPLTERGHQQAEFIAERASKLPIQCIIASTMTRAQQTAEKISKKTGLTVESSDLFVESKGPSEFIDVVYTDPKARDAYKAMRDNYGKPGWRYSNAENFEDHTKRAQAALAFLAERKEEHILVVSHGLFLRLLAAHVVFGPTPTPYECQRFIYGMETENTGLTIFDHAEKIFDGSPLENPWQVFVWNDHAHLAD